MLISKDKITLTVLENNLGIIKIFTFIFTLILRRKPIILVTKKREFSFPSKNSCTTTSTIVRTKNYLRILTLTKKNANEKLIDGNLSS